MKRPNFTVVSGVVAGLVLAGEFVFFLVCRHQFLAVWGDTSKAQIMSSYLSLWASFIGLAVTTILVYVTAIYVHANNVLVKINSEQYERTEQVFVEFGLGLVAKRTDLTILNMWIANLGVSNFMVTEVEYQQSDCSTPERFVKVQLNRVVTAGAVEVIQDIPKFYAVNTQPYGTDVQIRLRTQLLGKQEWTPPRGFNLLVSEHGNYIIEVRDGYHAPRPYCCPKCKQAPIYMVMTIDGIKNEQQFLERKKIFLDEFEASCPHHDSQFRIQLNPDNSL